MLASSLLWVAKIIVLFNFFNFKKYEKISREVLKSKFPVGSSAKIRSVSEIKALAIATLCCSPPDNSSGKWLCRLDKLKSASMAFALLKDFFYPHF